MTEQATAATQITAASDSMKTQSEQAAKAMIEQSKAIADLTGGATNVSKQIKLITHANREHAAAADGFLHHLTDIRRASERNVEGARETLNSSKLLLENSEGLRSLMSFQNGNGHGNGNGNGNGQPRKKARKARPVSSARAKATQKKKRTSPRSRKA